LIAAAIVAVVFLIRLFVQLRTTAAEAEKTLVEVRVLAENLSELDLEIKDRVEELGAMLGTSRKAGVSLSEGGSPKLLPASAKFLPLVLPVARFVLRKMKKK
jgi:hypothetical protein